MKHWIIKRLLVMCCILLSLGCSDDEWLRQSTVGRPVDVVLNFGTANSGQVSIKTRTTYNLYYESMVRNVYVFVFNVSGGKDKIYGRYFGADELNNTTSKEYWTVNNMSSDNTGTHTTGTLHLSIPSASANVEIVLIANIDLDFMNVSQERLGLVRTKADLNELVVSLNQEIPDRNAGYFMMTGESNATISTAGAITVPDETIMLDRLDAKIEVNVCVNPEKEYNSQRIKEFTPESWQVINLPQSAYLISNDKPLQLAENSYFNLSPSNFETTENEVINGSETGGVLHGFSFYTLENMRSGDLKQSTGGNYHNRDRRNTNADGTYNTESGLWKYAPELATYIIIKGELTMVVNPNTTGEQHLVADVTYCIHLGDFSSDKDNYDIKRNTYYKYTINIRGVDNIELEVETSNDDEAGITEKQPGAMGHLYEAEEDIYTFDAHYGQRVFTIKAGDVDVDNMTWYVRTPFGREGIPSKDESGKEIYNDLDYKWVEFMLNDRTGAGNNYSDTNMPYPADRSKLMNVIEMLELMKTEFLKWDADGESLFDGNGEIKLTVFVDEFYYETNPMNPNDPDVLWKKFVNQPNRLMHILCKNNRSADDDSSVTGSILTIRQRSIQTPFNINPANTDLLTAWGCETTDETKNQAWFYHPGEKYNNFDASVHKPSYTSDNTSRTDGLYNTACLLNLIQGTGTNKSVNTELRWDTFIDYTENEVKLKEQYNAGLYSVLIRNRDLDGDGIIDPEELRWYIASLDQLCGLFLGDQGLSTDAQLYPIEASREPNVSIDDNGPFHGCFPWRLHVVSSTAWEQTANNRPTIVWAEEGASTGEYQVHHGKPGYSPVRCMRNLGMPAATAANITVAGNNYPTGSLVKVTKPTGSITPTSVYKFDFTNMNEESRRYYTTRELVPDDEYSVMSRLYDGFETGELKSIGVNYHANNGLKSILENGGSPQQTPEGYRVPNVREGVAMYLYCQDNANWWQRYYSNGETRYRGTMVSTYYSFGYFGNQYDKQGTTHYYSWAVFPDRVTVGDPGNTYVRFVKDIQP